MTTQVGEFGCWRRTNRSKGKRTRWMKAGWEGEQNEGQGEEKKHKKAPLLF